MAVAVSHLFDIQEVMGIPIMFGPEIDEYPGATAPTVHNQPVAEVRVFSVRGFEVPHSGQIPEPGKDRKWA